MNINQTIQLIFIIFILLCVLWLFIESAVSIGVRNGILHAENIKKHHFKKLAKKTVQNPRKNTSESETNTNMCKSKGKTTSTNRDI